MFDKLNSSVPVDLPAGKDRFVYTILGALFGHLGVHNLWAGGEFAEKGKAQLIVGLVGMLCCCSLPNIYTWFTSVKDVATVK